MLPLLPLLMAASPCPDHEPQRRPYFGDLHVHTALSHDAATQGTRTRPRDAYRFARGEELGLQPYDTDGRPLRTLKLSRPLDFTAVTDHSELLGEVYLCGTPGSAAYDAWICRVHRAWPRASFFIMNTHVSRGTGRRMGFCGKDGEVCRNGALSPWHEIIEAAHDANAPCDFTSFVGYEWTGSIVGRNLHRNVIFANEQVPELPIDYYAATTPEALWEGLRVQCTEAGTGCDALAIPHNSNLSAGLMFKLEDDLTADAARTRSRWEPLVEVMQHKGDSECLWQPGSADELCAFEQLPFDSFRGKFVGFTSHGPRREDTVRDALEQGLVRQQTLGANPFKLGLIASTDTHLGTPGAVDPKTHPGHGGAGAPSPDSLPLELPDDAFFNPGGLAVLWAQENTRESLFAAMRRREVYGTSGPRMVVRLFAAPDLPANLCERTDFVATGYARGVPMGGDLPPGGSAVFAVSALRDPERAPLERIQLIKGWVENGEAQERVVDVAVSKPGGSNALCSVWRDPDFDPKQPAFWYARVVEVPTPRWQSYVCRTRGLDCSRYDVPETVRQRAWTSPIWSTPERSNPERPTPEPD